MLVWGGEWKSHVAVQGGQWKSQTVEQLLELLADAAGYSSWVHFLLPW